MRFELRSLLLLGKCFMICAIAPVFLVIFHIGSPIFCSGQPELWFSYLHPHLAGVTGITSIPGFFVGMGSCKLFAQAGLQLQSS
jgi:hypothetical protein